MLEEGPRSRPSERARGLLDAMSAVGARPRHAQHQRSLRRSRCCRAAASAAAPRSTPASSGACPTTCARTGRERFGLRELVERARSDAASSISIEARAATSPRRTRRVRGGNARLMRARQRGAGPARPCRSAATPSAVAGSARCLQGCPERRAPEHGRLVRAARDRAAARGCTRCARADARRDRERARVRGRRRAARPPTRQRARPLPRRRAGAA